MVIINKNSANSLALTLSEKQTLDTPYYLFVFINEQTDKVKSCIASVTTGTRYDSVTITENSTEDNLNGVVSLAQPGEWMYRVYEQSSATNLSADGATGLLEEGKCKVIGTAQTIKRYNGTRTAKAYIG